MPAELALFPLQTVLFPGGKLGLKVFEARYLDLIGRCLRERQPFGVIALRRGAEVRGGADPVVLEEVGCLAVLDEVDSPTPGILQVQGHGTQRFRALQPRQQPDGLWVADAEWLADDEVLAPPEALRGSAQGLQAAIATLRAQGHAPFLEPYRFEDAGWLANRWCEILPIPLAAKQKLMELPDPLVRLRLVDEFLRGKGVVA